MPKRVWTLTVRWRGMVKTRKQNRVSLRNAVAKNPDQTPPSAFCKCFYVSGKQGRTAGRFFIATVFPATGVRRAMLCRSRFPPSLLTRCPIATDFPAKKVRREVPCHFRPFPSSLALKFFLSVRLPTPILCWSGRLRLGLRRTHGCIGAGRVWKKAMS